MLLFKALAAPVLAFAFVSATEGPGNLTLPRGPDPYSVVHKIECDQGSGTGFAADGKFLSVAHVTGGTNCEVAGQRITAANDDKLDFSVAGIVKGGFTINCEGFKEGEYYFASGYAFGGRPRVLILMGTGQYDPVNGMAILWGNRVIPGMSGGPILNVKAEVVGVINAYNLLFPMSFSRELKGTSVCR